MNYIFTFTCFAIFFPLQSIAQCSDEKAIQQLLENETKDFLVIPISELVLKHWKLDGQTRMVVTEADGGYIDNGMDELLAIKGLVFLSDMEIIKTDHFVHINGNSAFASHEQIFVDKKTKAKIFSHEIRVLEKIDGVWKIHISNVHQYNKG